MKDCHKNGNPRVLQQETMNNQKTASMHMYEATNCYLILMQLGYSWRLVDKRSDQEVCVACMVLIAVVFNTSTNISCFLSRLTTNRLDAVIWLSHHIFSTTRDKHIQKVEVFIQTDITDWNLFLMSVAWQKESSAQFWSAKLNKT